MAQSGPRESRPNQHAIPSVFSRTTLSRVCVCVCVLFCLYLSSSHPPPVDTLEFARSSYFRPKHAPAEGETVGDVSASNTAAWKTNSSWKLNFLHSTIPSCYPLGQSSSNQDNSVAMSSFVCPSNQTFPPLYASPRNTGQ